MVCLYDVKMLHSKEKSQVKSIFIGADKKEECELAILLL